MVEKQKVLYDYLGSYSISDGKYTLYHISTKEKLDSILRWGLAPPRISEEQMFDEFDPRRSVYLIAREIYVPVFLEEYQIESGLSGNELVLFEVHLPTTWPVDIDPSSLHTEDIATAFISKMVIPASALKIIDEREPW